MEPPLGLLADRGYRRRIVIGGGIAFVAGTLAFAGAQSFILMLGALALLDPASGAFVSLSQATLMDSAPAERERNMARWTIAGSVGAAVGPLLLVAGVPWRVAFVIFACLTAPVVLAMRQHRHDAEPGDEPASEGIVAALRNREVLRWLLLLELQDLGADVLVGFLALYLVDVARADTSAAALAVFVWTGAGLAGNALLLPLLRRVDGLRWLRLTAAAFIVLFPGFQLLPGLAPKLAVAAMLGALVSGWYPISQARLYDALPGRSGLVTAVSTSASVLGVSLPLLLGLLAGRFGLGTAFWLVLVAPVALLVGVPRR